jgi:outer membrane lipoprotein SlyB
MRHISWKMGLLALATATLVSGCATYDEPRSYRYNPYYEASTYPYAGVDEERAARYGHPGVIVDLATVEDWDRSSGGGALLGGIIGGVLGNQIGSGSGRAAATIGGALAGGAIGNRIEQDRHGYALEITVRLDNGDVVSVLQDHDRGFDVGDRVRIIGWGRDARVFLD